MEPHQRRTTQRHAVRSTTMRCSAATLIGPSSTRSTESRGRPPANAANASPPGLDVASKPTRSPSFIRRRANANAPARWLVEPLHVVDRDDERTTVAQHPQDAHDRCRHDAGIDRLGARLLQQQHHRQRPALRRRKHRKHIRRRLSDEVTKPGERHPGVDLGRSRADHPPAGRCATPIASDHTSVLPIPAAPDSTRPAGPCATRARNLRVAATSASRPCSADLSRTSTTSPRRESPATTAVPSLLPPKPFRPTVRR